MGRYLAVLAHILACLEAPKNLARLAKYPPILIEKLPNNLSIIYISYIRDLRSRDKFLRSGLLIFFSDFGTLCMKYRHFWIGLRAM